MYQCVNSTKCISRRRLKDEIIDCVHADDEQSVVARDACALGRPETYFNCTTTNQCIPRRFMGDGHCHCQVYDLYENKLCDDEYPDVHYIRKMISFTTICDGFTELYATTIDGEMHTDETECDQWQCDNTYTHCDGYWNCLNGADEVGCAWSPLLNCSSDQHLCVSPQTSRLSCLPVEKANDGKIDCLGATDEPILCRTRPYQDNYSNFRCTMDPISECTNVHDLCGSGVQCTERDYLQICDEMETDTNILNICHEYQRPIRTDALNFLCERPLDFEKTRIVHFSLAKVRHPRERMAQREKIIPLPLQHQARSSDAHHQRCHRGFFLRVALDSDRNSTRTVCLCPPSYYGDMCQFQNQRVSLTLQLRTLSDAWRTLFAVVVSLIDDSDERLIHSHQQFTFVPILDCQIKFNMYLLYSMRPKNSSSRYSLHIDIYEKVSLAYRGSWLTPLLHPFLPVHRLVLQPVIERSSSVVYCVDRRCIHGRCIMYLNDRNESTFCQCDRGWSGRFCTTPHSSMCSPDSTFVGVLANHRSVCACPLNRFGSRCLLYHTACKLDRNVTCLNGGQCVAVDEHIVSTRKFTCLCPKGFSRDRCESSDTKIIVSFHADLVLPQVMLLHFIQVIRGGPPKRATNFRTIPTNRHAIVVDWSDEFHLLFVELFKKDYYLAVVQQTHQPSTSITKTLHLSDRCEHLSELFNETIVQLHLLRRIKYYQLPCQRHSPQLPCFFDEKHLCFCYSLGQKRLANCVEFDHQLEFNCFGRSGCENGAQCFQDSASCAKTSMCRCSTCFYGARCQFSTRDFSLSLDVILAYHILPHISLVDQPAALQMSVALTIVMGLLGFTDGILSIITFQDKKLREVGCGYYLLGTSITTVFTTTVFVVKFWILVWTQMTLNVNLTFLSDISAARSISFCELV